MKLGISDIVNPLMCFVIGSIFLTGFLPNALYEGWLIVSFGFLFIGLTIFENITRCEQCRLYEKHNLIECFDARLKSRKWIK